MNKFQATLAVVALGSSVLVGCANTSALESKLDAIAADVDALKAQQSKLANDVAFVKSDAARANERLDNLARRYKQYFLAMIKKGPLRWAFLFPIKTHHFPFFLWI